MEVDQGARWRDRIRHAHREAARFTLALNMNDDASRNGCGGPWIRPEHSMRKVVWTEKNIVGPVRFTGTLPRPERVAGFYRVAHARGLRR